ncbi:MAG: SCP2 sterol-binding domain-containing protein [Dehalococcoidia bacterium]|nr:SCP2 sterol-binding domain-containing protein [Dehalococcoidia bacterium]
MAMFGTLEWATQFMEAVNNSKAYEDAAKTWEGDFYFIIEPGGAVKETGYQYVDLWHGKCRKVDIVTEAEKDKYKPEFILSASIATWRKVAEKKVDPIQAIVTRQLKLTGNMGKVMRAVKAAQELVNCVTQVKTEYPE